MGITYNSNGSQSDVIAKIALCSDGDIVTIPSGDFTWSTSGGVNISGKGIKLQGAGAGRALAYSGTNIACGTGTKVFTLNASGIAGITNGMTLRIERTGTAVSGGNATGTRTWMEGTVTSYSGATLTMNITSSANAVTQSVWTINSVALTKITHNVAGTLLTLTEDASNVVEIEGIRFIDGTGTSYTIAINGVTSGIPIQIHDCYFECNTSHDTIEVATNRGIIYDSDFASFPFSLAPLAIHHQPDSETSSWTTASTMGTDDTTGKNNFYVEDCGFHAWLNAVDSDSNGRIVWRRNLMHNAAFGTHGADTSNYGVRHYEVYDNTFIFNAFSGGSAPTQETLNMNWWFYLRGGTGVITGNYMPTIISGDYGNKGAINMTCMQLQRNAGPNGGWGVISTSGRSGGWAYPAPRQVGRGYVAGSAVLPAWSSGGPYPGPGATWSGNYATYGGATYKSTTANTSSSNPSVNTGQWTNTGYATGRDSITFIGDLEPLYIWDNGSGYPAYGTSDYGVDQTNSVSTSGTPITCDSSANYIQASRDYYVDTTGSPSSGAKPGWTRYSYPHPLRTDLSGSVPTSPSGLNATAVSSSQIDLTWTDNSSDETGFEVDRSIDNSNYTNIATSSSNATGYSSTGLSASTTYYYRVRAVNGSGNSSYTTSANATTSAYSANKTFYGKVSVLGKVV